MIHQFIVIHVNTTIILFRHLTNMYSFLLQNVPAYVFVSVLTFDRQPEL